VPNNVDTQVEYFIATPLEIPLEKPDGTAVDYPTDFRQSKVSYFSLCATKCVFKIVDLIFKNSL
jgi:hypothetical protein